MVPCPFRRAMLQWNCHSVCKAIAAGEGQIVDQWSQVGESDSSQKVA